MLSPLAFLSALRWILRRLVCGFCGKGRRGGAFVSLYDRGRSHNSVMKPADYHGYV